MDVAEAAHPAGAGHAVGELREQLLVQARELAALGVGERAEHLGQLAHLRREQRPRFGHGAPAGTDLAARGRLVASATGSIQADASTRAAAGEFNGPIMRVQCKPYPPAAGAVPADEIASRPAGRYACLAVTSEIPATPGNPSGVLGHPYRARIDFRSGRYAFCKVSGRPGELAIRARPAIPVPKVCGG